MVIKMNENKKINKKYLKLGSFSIIMTAVVIAVVIVINLFIAELPSTLTKLDMSGKQLYTIGAETEAVIDAVDEDVTFYIVAQRGTEDSTIQNLLSRYAAMNSKIKVEVADPITNPTFIEQYTSESLSQNSVIAVSGKRSYAVDYYEIYTVEYSDEELYYYYYYGQMPTGTSYFNGELALTTALDYVTRDDLPIAYFLTGHGESTLSDTYKSYITTENIQAAELSLLTLDSVPEDATAVIIVNPTSDLSEDDRDKLIDYSNGGGNVILVTGAVGYNSVNMPNFDALTKAHGLESVDGLVIETSQNNYMMTQHYLLPNLGDTSYEPLSMLAYPNSTYVLANASHGIISDGTTSVNALLATTSGAYVKADIYAKDLSKAEGDVSGTFLIGASVENEEGGKFVWYSSAGIVDDSADSWVSGGNSSVFMATVGWMCENKINLSIMAKQLQVQALSVTEADVTFWSAVVVFIVPITVFLIGFIVWYRRRKK